MSRQLFAPRLAERSPRGPPFGSAALSRTPAASALAPTTAATAAAASTATATACAAQPLSNACYPLASGHQSARLSAGGHTSELPVHFKQHSLGQQQQLLRYLNDRQADGQYSQTPRPQAHLEAQRQYQSQLLHAGHGSAAAGCVGLSPLLSVFSNMSSLPPALSHPPLPLPAAFSVDFELASPRSTVDRASYSSNYTHASTPLSTSLCQSPSSSLSSSSYMSLDDALDDYGVEALVDPFHAPPQLLAPNNSLLTQYAFHGGMGAEPHAPQELGRTGLVSGGSSSALLASLLAAPHGVDQVPALPLSGGTPPGSLAWQHGLLSEEWTSSAQQLVSSLQQQQLQTGQWRAQQRPSEAEQLEGQGQVECELDEEALSGGEQSVEADSGTRCAGSGDELDSSSADESDAGLGARGRRAGSLDRSAADMSDDTDGSSSDESSKATRTKSETRRRSKAGRARSRRGGVKCRAKKRKRSQRSKERVERSHSDGSEADSSGSSDSDEERAQERKRRRKRKTGRTSRSAGTAAEMRKRDGGSTANTPPSLSPSPLFSPSPSSFSTSTAASSASAASTAASGTASSVTDGTDSPYVELLSGGSPVRFYSHRSRALRRPSGGGHRSKLPARVVAVLRSFFLHHVSHPFPCETEKRQLVSSTGLSLKQVCDWFTNNRKRYWKPYERRMASVGCRLVGERYRSAQHRAAHQSSRRSGGGRAASGGHSGGGRDSGAGGWQQRTVCRCGEENVAIHDWRQMWD